MALVIVRPRIEPPTILDDLTPRHDFAPTASATISATDINLNQRPALSIVRWMRGPSRATMSQSYCGRPVRS